MRCTGGLEGGCGGLSEAEQGGRRSTSGLEQKRRRLTSGSWKQDIDP